MDGRDLLRRANFPGRLANAQGGLQAGGKEEDDVITFIDSSNSSKDKKGR